ncbi:hypothetical protein SK128_023860 [Halocaridina rubra]|uniref:Juvenile hormone esterase binding protein n=1 Tax=Halocaridina rubra TaxID=373956 RepID=A0AAN9A0J7_HALRR
MFRRILIPRNKLPLAYAITSRSLRCKELGVCALDVLRLLSNFRVANFPVNVYDNYVKAAVNNDSTQTLASRRSLIGTQAHLTHFQATVLSCSQQRRYFRSEKSNLSFRRENDKPSTSRSPELMNFPWIVWPSVWHTIRNWIFANLIIKPYMDKEFTLASFKAGAIQALVHVSQEISKGNFSALEGLITKPSLEEAQSNFAVLSLKQRLDLAVVAEDIFFCFPYQIGVMFTNEGGPKERVFVEITMCYHIFKGFQDHIENISKSPATGSFSAVYDNYDRISIANYRFIREFTKGVDDQWTVNVANHFKPGESLQQQR